MKTNDWIGFMDWINKFHWENHIIWLGKCVLKIGLISFIGLVENFNRNPPPISWWKNPWFPVKIFPWSNPVKVGKADICQLCQLLGEKSEGDEIPLDGCSRDSNRRNPQPGASRRNHLMRDQLGFRVVELLERSSVYHWLICAFFCIHIESQKWPFMIYKSI